MLENFLTFASIENNIQFGVGDRFAQCFEEGFPGSPMCGMTVDHHTVHIEHDTA
jgi:hypothetical protein